MGGRAGRPVDPSAAEQLLLSAGDRGPVAQWIAQRAELVIVGVPDVQELPAAGYVDDENTDPWGVGIRCGARQGLRRRRCWCRYIGDGHLVPVYRGVSGAASVE